MDRNGKGMAISRQPLSVCAESLATLEPDYSRLCGITANALPFCLYSWHAAWSRNLLHRRPGVHERWMFYVVRDSQGIAIAIFPLIHSQRRVGPFNTTSLEFLGADPALTEIRGPLIETGFERAALHAVRGELALQRDWDWIQWATTSTPLIDALREVVELDSHEIVPDLLLDLPDTWEGFRRGLKRNIRESLRHCYNSLKRAGHTFTFRVTQAPADVPAALTRFFELHVMRAHMGNAEPHPNRFASQVSRDFLLDVCTEFAARGELRLFELEIGGKIVAARIGFLVGDSLYLYYSGFDPAWRKFSVMTTTVAEAIKYAIRTGLKTVNLSPGADTSKMRWSPRVVKYHIAYETRPGILSRVAHLGYRYLRCSDQSPARLLRRLLKSRRDWK